MNSSRSSNSNAAPTERTRVRRHPERAAYDPEVIDGILDQAWIAHVGFVSDGQPYVIPMSYVRLGRRVYFHGSAAGRTPRALAGGISLCFTVMILDGLVLARSHFAHSMNYRSVVVLGGAEPVDDPTEKQAALEALIERFVPGRARETRAPSSQELKATSVLRLGLEEASAKIRSGPALDYEIDLSRACWAGVIPLALHAGAPQPDPLLEATLPPPKLSLLLR